MNTFCVVFTISDYYYVLCWKQLWTSYILFFRIHRWIEISKEHILFKIETFCNIINAFIVTFDQFNASLLNKNINYFRPQTFERYCKYKTNIISIYISV